MDYDLAKTEFDNVLKAINNLSKYNDDCVIDELRDDIKQSINNDVKIHDVVAVGKIPSSYIKSNDFKNEIGNFINQLNENTNGEEYVLDTSNLSKGTSAQSDETWYITSKMIRDKLIKLNNGDDREGILKDLARFTKNGIKYKKVINIKYNIFNFYRHCDMIDNLRCFDKNGKELDFEITNGPRGINVKNLRRIFISQTVYTILELVCEGVAKITYDAINLADFKCDRQFYDSENDIAYGCGQIGRKIEK